MAMAGGIFTSKGNEGDVLPFPHWFIPQTLTLPPIATLLNATTISDVFSPLVIVAPFGNVQA